MALEGVPIGAGRHTKCIQLLQRSEHFIEMKQCNGVTTVLEGLVIDLIVI
jgi:hypothetical protein